MTIIQGYQADASLADFTGRRPSDNLASFSSYNAARSPQEPTYQQYALPGQAEAHPHFSTMGYGQQADQVVYSANADDRACASYEATATPYQEFADHKAPDLSPYAPQSGNPDPQVSVFLGSPEALAENTRQPNLQPAPEITRKRKMTLESTELSTASKKISPSYRPVTNLRDYDAYGPGGLAYTQDLRLVDVNSMQQRLTPYERSPNYQNVQDDRINTSVHNFSENSADAQSLMRPPMAQNSNYSPSYATHQTSRSPGLSSTASFQLSSSSSPSPANPPLIRASTLQQQVGPLSTSTASAESGYNSYGFNRAFLKIRGDLDSMQNDWTPEERMAKRRLVQFRGEQNGSTINTYFTAVKPDDRPSPTESREKRVSCIYCEDRDEYYVTSVDTISLLETLVGNRFTVEEKNRIRRNLETHHPLTVSKSKPDTENFFKVIMGFPIPKPRNIEKDVKVFPWPILAPALKKVISKYVSSRTLKN